MTPAFKAAFLLSAAVTALAATAASAQPVEAPAEELDRDSGDIIVTARRVEERLQDVPISMTVFNQEQISNRNIVTGGDLATYTPSLTASSRFGPENTSFAIRGFTQENGTSPSVGVYFAEVVPPRANGSTASGNGAGAGALFDLQNVQVLKGPQGTLFGRNTTGDAIILTPRKPTGELEGYIEGSIGSYDMVRLQGVLNVPLSDTFRVRLGVDTQKRDGYINNLSGIGPRDFGNINYKSFRLSIVGDLTPDLENYTIFSYSKSNTHGTQPKVYTGQAFTAQTNPRVIALINAQLAATPGFYDVLSHMADPYNRLEQWQVINTTTWKASDTITIKNIASYGEFRQQQSLSVFGEYGVSNNPAIVPAGYTFYTGTISRNARNEDTTAQSTFTDELQLQGIGLDGRLNYQFGGYLEISNPLGFQHTVGPSGLACAGNPDDNQCIDLRGTDAGLPGVGGNVIDSAAKYTFRNYGLYAQATFKLTAKLSVTGGVRYTWDKSEVLSRLLRANFFAPNVPTWSCSNAAVPGVIGGTSAQVRADPSRCDINFRQSSSRPTWMVDVEYKPTEDIMLYAKYSRGYRQGGVNGASYGGATWGPEKLDAYEIGAKTSFSGAISGYFNIAGFYNAFKDQQLQTIFLGCSTAQVLINQSYSGTGPTPPGYIATCPFAVSSAAGIANAGSSSIKGFEIDGSINVLRGLRFDFGYAYLDTKLDSLVPQLTPNGYTAVLPRAIVGGELPLVPRHKLTLTGAYTLPLDESVGAITVSATYTYQSRAFSSIGSPPGNQHMAPQNNVNLNLNWKSIAGQPVDLSLFVTNLTNEQYYTNLLGGSSFNLDSGIINEPRMFGARVRVRFGS